MTIMIMNPMYPQAAKSRVFCFGKDQCIFDGNTRLIVVAIAHPFLQLQSRELALVHQSMHWMTIVISRLAFALKPRDEIIGG